MEPEGRFRYARSEHLPDLTVLQATMTTFSYDRHAHEEYAFGVTLSGRQDFFSSGAYHRSTPGTVIHFSPSEMHDGHSGSDTPLNYVMAYIPRERLEPLLAVAGDARAGDIRLDAPRLKDPALKRHIMNLVWLVATRSGDRIEEEQALYRIAARVAQRAGRFEADDTARKPDALLLRAKDYIDGHAGAHLSLDDISRAANLSKFHFLRLFRRQFGITPHKYLLNCRVNAARAALEAGAALDDVVYRYGFADLSHFNRRFKRIYGMTPRQYQKSVAR